MKVLMWDEIHKWLRKIKYILSLRSLLACPQELERSNRKGFNVLECIINFALLLICNFENGNPLELLT